MIYLAIDARAAQSPCACAGHPPPRLVAPDGTVERAARRGLALGVDPGQEYDGGRERTVERGGASSSTRTA